MSWKDLKVAKKMYIGFGIVLALTIAVGIISINGLQTVAQTQQNAKDVDALVKWVKDCAVARRDFVNTSEKKYAETVVTTLGKMNDKMDEVKARLSNQSDKDAVETARKKSQDYKQNFEPYVKITLDKLEARKTMDEDAKKAQSTAENSQAKEAKQILADFQYARLAAKNFVLTGDAQYDKQFDEIMANIQSKYKGADPQLMAALQAYNDAENKFVSFEDEQNKYAAQVGTAASEFITACDVLGKSQDEKMASAQSSAVTLATTFAIVAVLVGIFVAFFISRGISRPISVIASVADDISKGDIDHDIHVVSKDEVGMLAESFRKLIVYMKSLAVAAEKIAQNDLTVTVTPQSEKDVLGNSFKTMLNGLSTMIRQLRENATQLASAAAEISSSSEQMAAGAKNQTDQSTQVATAVEEMSSTIVQSSKNANEARGMAESAATTSNEGQKVVGETIIGMVKIADSAQQSGKIVHELAQASDRIGEIIGVIDDIADQTNLLALNAAIEAARAGEQGRGFAVVADEVRKLAERTGKATGEITEMIKGIQSDSTRAVTSMEEASKLVEEGKHLADQAGTSLNEINAIAQKVMDMIVQIATATDQQSAAAEQISKNMEHITSVTKETATGAEQSAAAAEELNRQAEGLQQMVSQFRLHD